MPNARYGSYIICTSPRSGSTLLCKLLSATEKAGDPESHFHTPALSRWLETYQLDGSDFASDRDALNAIFEAARKRGSAETGIFGLRLQRGSFDFFMQQTAILYPNEKNDINRIQAAFGRTLFIHLSRPNKLDQAISIVKATQTGLWHRASDGSEMQRISAPQEPYYDAGEIARQIEELSVMDLAWQDWFDHENVHLMRVTYDALSHDPIGTLEGILDALGLDSDLADGIEPPVSKLSDATNRDWADRFRREQSRR